ncbi:MAG: PD-(D/E)XK nuclease family transposase [Fretibacterium sp.]|nr:PD-(D/E)XK nuclease family transposase [Fretibacterium sp.]
MARDLERIRNYCLMDDVFMSECLKDIPCVELVLKIILQRDVRVTEVRTQEVMRSWRRGAQLDVFATDEEDDRYNVEVQRKSEGAALRRARYHISLMDTYALYAGEDFDELRDNYVIFITERDVLKGGLPLYTIDRVIRETGQRLEDGAHILYVNGAMRDADTPLGKLMHDFFCKDPDQMHYRVLADRTRYFKENEEGIREMSSASEELREEGRREGEKRGRKEGLKEGKMEAAQRMLQAGELALEKIAQYSGLPLLRVQELAWQAK